MRGLFEPSVLSGALSVFTLGSGAVAAYTLNVSPINSGAYGGGPAVITSEIVSGVRAVQIDPSGHIRIAMSAVSGRMPAVGVATDNALSGIRINVYVAGVAQHPTAGSGQTIDGSGLLGTRVWVGMSGQLVGSSGSAWTGGGSGGWLSGSIMQAVGTFVNSGGIVLNIDPSVLSGSVSSGLLAYPLGAL